MVRAIVGANWGDEGKGKITDMLAKESDLKGFAGKKEEELTAGQTAACRTLKEELLCIREAQDEMQ